jgi:hypothetical protein
MLSRLLSSRAALASHRLAVPRAAKFLLAHDRI